MLRHFSSSRKTDFSQVFLAPFAPLCGKSVAFRIRSYYPIVAHLKGRNEIVTIHTAQDGHRYTVRSIDGRILLKSATVREIKANLPEVYEQFRGTFAGPILWMGE